jgi:calcineurin-like phosphoesterase family protein
MAEFFIADMHFGSGSNAKWRKFTGAGEMEATISAEWKRKVGAEDTVWVLGDVGSLHALTSLPGVKHLVFGNDDKPKRDFKESELFASAANSHIHQSSYGTMFLVHRPQDAPLDSLPVLHGHTHGMPDEADCRFVSVSVDKTGWGPISLEEVWRRIRQRSASH